PIIAYNSVKIKPFPIRQGMVMAEIECVYCGNFFEESPRHKNQMYCEKKVCKNAKKAAWQRHKIKTDPDYRANQKSSQKGWVQENLRLLEKISQEKP
ncbi:MAG: hypothetical protein U9R17_17640, partial [Thermodesulfobacteriota bacterium]|nr:hypothetical protein [Thermodesulfobacteriota bacterium]